MANAADGDGLVDLELIMDANLSSSSIAHATLGAAPPPEELEVELHSEVVDRPAQRHFIPCGNLASLSLALNTLMPLSSKVGVLPRKLLAKPPANLPSQKKANSPIPVVPSSKLKFGLDVEPQQQQQSSASKICSSATAFPDYQMLPRSGRRYGNPAAGAGMRRASIVWFRNDLRVHDNEALAAANKESLSVIPVYCFDPKDYGKSASGFDKTGPYRAKFLVECVANLRDNLRERGSELVVRIGNPVEVLSTIAKAVGADGLYAHQEVSSEELGMEDKVTSALKDQNVDVKFFWGSTLFHVDDLPFKVEDMPSNYGGFRDKVKDVQVRAATEAPKQLKGLPSQGDVKAGDIPSLQELGLSPVSAAGQQEKHKRNRMIGGEVEALKRLKSFSLVSPPPSKGGKENSIYGANFSSKISPWLAMGCLSPRKMFEDLKKTTSRLVPKPTPTSIAPSSAASGDSGMQWLVFELLWRDFFRFVTKKHGAAKKTQTEAVPAMACA
ncbi:blue-light photoreceptor PHR2 isoform X1 [Selaginella moellendorffii]|uniref:blue-light photoreceptor PHR2 isoform X1 n=1 Tax=Selaginella moellendorffii TaxID=88036 RepID=UPI000D1CC476|nr:blue-light photoreceptor PHR2 isoform X1 [Selaginella moellendorffii]|eukprot:XP_024538727.1 blue-light photoreceptor PHR2 isoform X1 [Selaginella moellendorffii]